MSIPLLPSNILSEIFTQLLQEDIKFSNPGDNQNFQRFKRYLSKQWCRGIDAEILSVYSLENATNNGAESFHSMLKNVIKVHKPSIWSFVLRLNEIFSDKYLDYKRMEEFGTEGFIRSRRPQVQQNINRRRAAETKLSNGELSPFEFLLQVSYTYENIVQRLQYDLRTQPNVLDEDPDVQDHADEASQEPVEDQELANQANNQESNGNVVTAEICNVCHDDLPNYRKALRPCGHTKTCGKCLDTILSNGNPICPCCREPIVDYFGVWV